MFYHRLIETFERHMLEEMMPKTTHADRERYFQLIQKTLASLRNVKLFLFDSDQAEVFINRSYPFDEYPHFIFDKIFINFTRPLNLLEEDEEGRDFGGVLIEQVDGIKKPIKGGSFTWYSLQFNDYITEARVVFDQNSFPAMSDGHSGTDNRFYRLGINLMYFLSNKDIELLYHEPTSSRELENISERVQYPFYTVRFKRSGERTKTINTGTGVPHSYRYDVRGHFRHLRDERYKRNEDGTYKVIWVGPHQRGLEHELYIPALRDVTTLPIIFP